MFGAIAGLVGGIGGALIGASSQRSANEANSANVAQQIEAQERADQKAMDFSERMSNTQWQRGTEDMARAGLNPMLAYHQGPASAPTGVAGARAVARHEPTFTPKSFGTAAQMAQFGQQIEQGMATTSNIKADTVNKSANESVIKAQAEQIRADTRLKILQAATEGYRPGEVINKADLARQQAEQIRQLVLPSLDNLRAQTDLSRSSAEQIRSQNVLMKGAQSSEWTKYWAPYLLEFLRSPAAGR